ncbi:MAG: type II/IV secretion system protein, partial [Planctomycetes bacterium]|nr:type II/IV secretion system protein [Planctomycetota bacterium]
MDQPMREYTDLLLHRGVVGLDQLSEATRMVRESVKPLTVGDCLVQLGYCTSEEVTQAMAQFHKMEFVDLNTIRIPDEVIQLVPESVAREQNVIPISEDGDALKVLISDPMAFETIEKLRFILNRRIETALAPRQNIAEAINRYYGQVEGESADSMMQEFTDTQIDFTVTDESNRGNDEGVDEDSAPIVKFVHLMIQEAVQLRASDIHVEPFEDRVRIRYRIDGILVERDSPPRRLLGAILSRIKILAKMDIAERRRPQDGRIKVTVGEKELDLRVSIIPTNHGQSSVMRILDKDNIKVGVRQLGLAERDFKNFMGLIKRPNGILLVTGPTGSGKTTTLYACLNALNRPDRKIITAEDPVEYYLPGINQVEVKHNIGLDFARIIKAML